MSAQELPADVVDLLLRRAERLREKAAAAEEEAVLWVAEVTSGTDSFAFPLSKLRAVIPLRFVTPVPHAPVEVVGIVRYEGEVLTVYSLPALMRGGGWRSDPQVLLVVELARGQRVAVDCERIPKPVSLPARLAAEGEGEPVTPVTTADLRQLSLVDLGALLERNREARRG